MASLYFPYICMMDFDTLKRISEDIGIENARKLYYDDEFWREIMRKEYRLFRGSSELYLGLGDRIMIGKDEGIVVSCYINDMPEWVMLDKKFKEGITWEEAMSLELPTGWKIPSKKEFMEFGENIALYKSRNENFSAANLGYQLWSTSEHHNKLYAWMLHTYSGTVGASDKNNNNYENNPIIRAFKKLKS